MAYKEIFARIAGNTFVHERVTTGRIFRPLVERFVAGETIEHGLSAVESLNNKGMAASLDFLGEEVHDEDAAASVREEYLFLLDVINKRGLAANISLKSTQLGLGFNPDLCRENIATIVERARDYGNFVRIDMEGSGYTSDILSLFYDLHNDYDNLGVVMQAYLYRTREDTQQLVEQQARIRLCKGAYSEPSIVAFPKKKKVDENYRHLMEYLLEYANYPAIATHDEVLIAHGQKFAGQHGIMPDKFEFQMLYGVRRDLQEKIVHDGNNLRIYVPYGKEWYPYLMRRMGERPANAFFVLKNIMRESLHRE